MRRRKRLTIKVVALGFAVAAMAAPTTAQAWIDETGGVGGTLVASPDDRAIHGLNYSTSSEPTVSVGADDRAIHGMNYPTYSEPVVVYGPDDRSLPRMSPTADQPTVVSSDDGFQFGKVGLTGIILALGAAAALIAVHETRRQRLASA